MLIFQEDVVPVFEIPVNLQSVGKIPATQAKGPHAQVKYHRESHLKKKASAVRIQAHMRGFAGAALMILTAGNSNWKGDVEAFYNVFLIQFDFHSIENVFF